MRLDGRHPFTVVGGLVGIADLPTLVAVPLILAAAVVAAYLPARRAARIDPAAALRDE